MHFTNIIMRNDVFTDAALEHYYCMIYVFVHEQHYYLLSYYYIDVSFSLIPMTMLLRHLSGHRWFSYLNVQHSDLYDVTSIESSSTSTDSNGISKLYLIWTSAYDTDYWIIHASCSYLGYSYGPLMKITLYVCTHSCCFSCLNISCWLIQQNYH